jgi:MurNAc alpha-1-phosphate uridylyltransferase
MTPPQILPPLAPTTPLATAMLLAAGRGERMRPLTDTTPKPLLTVRGRPLMVWCLQRMVEGGLKQVVINTAWLGEQIPAALGSTGPADLAGGPMQLHYSQEGSDFGGALETAGGIVRALPWLDQVFWVAAGDVFAPAFHFDPEAPAGLAASNCLAHLWLVPNPPHNPKGDFGLSNQGLALNLPAEHPGPRYTFSTIALYKQALFEPPWCDIPRGNPHGVKAALAPLLRRAMDQGLVSASLYTGAWTDVGTPQRLAELNQG